MTLRTTIEADATTVFCNTSDFAEPVKYYPRSGTPRCISAVVMREAIAVVNEDGSQAVLPMWQVHVANDCLAGIASTELNLGGDSIEFPPRDGQKAVRKSITQLVTQDNGMLVVECR